MSNRSSASGQKVNDQNRQPQNQQQVDQTSAHMKTENPEATKSEEQQKWSKACQLPVLIPSSYYPTQANGNLFKIEHLGQSRPLANCYACTGLTDQLLGAFNQAWER